MLKLSNKAIERREKVAILHPAFHQASNLATKTLHTGSRTLGPVRISCGMWLACQGAKGTKQMTRLQHKIS
jgi:hypothetical protein